MAVLNAWIKMRKSKLFLDVERENSRAKTDFMKST